MKLLVVSHACATAVNQAVYAELARQTGWAVDLVVPSNWRDEYGRRCPVERWPTFAGNLLAVPVVRPGDIIGHFYRARLGRLVRRSDPDAVYMAHEPYAAATAQVYRAVRRSGRDRPVGFYSAQNIVKRYPPPFRWWEAGVYRASRFAFPCSDAVAATLVAKGYDGPARVLPLAIDPAVYRPHPEAAAARRELTGGADAVVLGYVGRLVPEKGLRTLMAALAELPDANWRLAVVGAGPLEAELRATAAAAGLGERVRFCGFVPHTDAPRLLSAMDVLVLPSETQPNWREQFGRVVLEAMACGTPVLGSDSGEIPNLIRDTGGGVTFAERDVPGLATALRHLIDNPAETPTSGRRRGRRRRRPVHAGRRRPLHGRGRDGRRRPAGGSEMTQTDAKLRSATVDALEGWRGIACLLVVAYHCGLNLRLPGVTVLGFSGVHLFFVLSGYLLFRPYATAMMAGRPLPAVGNFYARRLVRIVPPYAVALAAYVLLRVVSHTKPPDGFNIATHAVLAFNYFPRVDLFSINPVFWSLAIEVQFYLLLPLAAVAAARVVPGRPAACAAGLFVAGVAARWLEVRHFRAAGGATTDVAFRSVFAYLDLFACGMAVACRPAGSVAGPAWRRWATVLLGLALAVAANDWCAATAGGDWQRGGSDAFLVLFPVALSAGVAMLLWTLTTPGRPGPAWLATGPLRWVGASPTACTCTTSGCSSRPASCTCSRAAATSSTPSP